ncbi:hypothetical protein SDC9_65056 [bioreactor metagenome]|uniref:HTH cro/C1-type domain-containing protein n=1 Tax=bioreactor metagenome TaxID=1076179 RepID=A0A644XWG8_9ZZZZ
MDDRCRGERFHDARNGEPMQSVYSKTNISTSEITDLENDDKDRGVRYQDIAKLADYYGVSVDWLLCRSDSISVNPEIDSACKFSGLSEKSLRIISEMDVYTKAYFDSFIQDDLFIEIIKGAKEYGDFVFAGGETPQDVKWSAILPQLPMDITTEDLINARYLSLSKLLRKSFVDAHRRLYRHI